MEILILIGVALFVFAVITNAEEKNESEFEDE